MVYITYLRRWIRKTKEKSCHFFSYQVLEYTMAGFEIHDYTPILLDNGDGLRCIEIELCIWLSSDRMEILCVAFRCTHVFT